MRAELPRPTERALYIEHLGNDLARVAGGAMIGLLRDGTDWGMSSK